MGNERRNGRPTVELIVPVYKPGVELAALLEKIREQSLLPAGVHLLVTAGEEEFLEIRGRYTRFWEELERGGTDEGKTDVSRGREAGLAKNSVPGTDIPAGKGMPALRFTRIVPEEFDHGGTRRRGAKESQADVLLFMTQDAVPADAFLVEHLVRALGYGEENERPCPKAAERGTGADDIQVAAAYARQLPAKDCRPIERFTRGFNYPAKSAVKTADDLPRLGIKTFFCSNVCAAYRREVYETLGGFCRRTIFNEDMILAAGLIRGGYGIAYASEARVVHSHNYSGWQQVRRNFDLAVSQADHPEVFAGIASEGEGIRMVKETADYLCKSGHAYLLPKLFWQSGCKYLGYLLGKRYRMLPRFLVRAITMNQRYWVHEKEM